MHHSQRPQEHLAKPETTPKSCSGSAARLSDHAWLSSSCIRRTCQLTPAVAALQAMLEQYSGENRGLRNLDAALRDAVQMVQVSDQRITYLRKMHALLLLRKWAAFSPLGQLQRAAWFCYSCAVLMVDSSLHHACMFKGPSLTANPCRTPAPTFVMSPQAQGGAADVR